MTTILKKAYESKFIESTQTVTSDYYIKTTQKTIGINVITLSLLKDSSGDYLKVEFLGKEKTFKIIRACGWAWKFNKNSVSTIFEPVQLLSELIKNGLIFNGIIKLIGIREQYNNHNELTECHKNKINAGKSYVHCWHSFINMQEVINTTQLRKETKQAYAEMKKYRKGTNKYKTAFEKWEKLHGELTKITLSGATVYIEL